MNGMRPAGNSYGPWWLPGAFGHHDGDNWLKTRWKKQKYLVQTPNGKESCWCTEWTHQANQQCTANVLRWYHQKCLNVKENFLFVNQDFQFVFSIIFKVKIKAKQTILICTVFSSLSNLPFKFKCKNSANFFWDIQMLSNISCTMFSTVVCLKETRRLESS